LTKDFNIIIVMTDQKVSTLVILGNFTIGGGLQLTGTQTLNRVISVPDITDTFTLEGYAASLTNKTITDSTNTVSSDAIKVISGSVVVSSAAPPVTGQGLVATSGTAAQFDTVPLLSSFPLYTTIAFSGTLASNVTSITDNSRYTIQLNVVLLLLDITLTTDVLGPADTVTILNAPACSAGSTTHQNTAVITNGGTTEIGFLSITTGTTITITNLSRFRNSTAYVIRGSLRYTF